MDEWLFEELGIGIGKSMGMGGSDGHTGMGLINHKHGYGWMGGWIGMGIGMEWAGAWGDPYLSNCLSFCLQPEGLNQPGTQNTTENQQGYQQ